MIYFIHSKKTSPGSPNSPSTWGFTQDLVKHVVFTAPNGFPGKRQNHQEDGQHRTGHIGGGHGLAGSGMSLEKWTVGLDVNVKFGIKKWNKNERLGPWKR